MMEDIQGHQLAILVVSWGAGQRWPVSLAPLTAAAALISASSGKSMLSSL